MAGWALALPGLAFDLQGHRGARGLAPENTLAAFRTALSIGVTTLETDLAVTRDGVLVISHDPFLNPDLARGDDGRWLAEKGPPIRTLALAELARYDVGRADPASRYARQFPEQRAADGERVPTLGEVFALGRASPKPVRFNIETKITPAAPDDSVDPAAFARLVVDATRSAGLADRVTIQSFDWRTLLEAKKLAPEIETVCLTIETADNDTVRRNAGGPSPWLGGLDLAAVGGSLPKLVKAAGCGTWSPFWRNVTASLVVEAHALGLKLIPWTVNEPANMAALIAIDVDGLITDYPNRLRKVMADNGIPLP
ncbi:MAG: glycerophosphodiester phosphodiesterase [Aromatoleum sp.]|nr:glycerophosphodiester phosphodiesterase [Aromatoleum sp.]